MTAGLHPLDWTIVAAYALSTIGLGVYFSRKQTTTQEYFTASGNVGPFFVGVSLFATLLSTIAYLSMPGEAAGKGPVVMAGILCYPIVYFVVGYLIVPAYMKQRVTSAYELLEQRLGAGVGLLGASMFLVLRLIWMTVLVYVAANAMTVMMGVDYWVIHQQPFQVEAMTFASREAEKAFLGFLSWQDERLLIAAAPIVVVATGLVALVYTTIGGLRTVIVTDFMQTMLLFGGALLVLITATYKFGGLGWFPTSWQPNWDAQPVFPSSFSTRVSLLGTVLSISVWYIATLAGDQTSVQRFMATKDAATAQRAIGTQVSVGFVIEMTLLAVGFALLAYFLAYRDQFPAEFLIEGNADDLFPYFIAYHLPIGVSGLVAAGMFAAAMSSIDSGVNSITAVVATNFVAKTGWNPRTEQGHLRMVRIIAVVVGGVVILGSLFIKYVDGNITAVTMKTVNLLTTPIFALFFFAMFVKSAKPPGVLIGTFFGVLTAAAIAFSGPLVVWMALSFGIDPHAFGVELAATEITTADDTEVLVPVNLESVTPEQTVRTAVYETNDATGDRVLVYRDPISFQWIGPIALLVNILIGSLVCSILNRRTSGENPPQPAR